MFYGSSQSILQLQTLKTCNRNKTKRCKKNKVSQIDNITFICSRIEKESAEAQCSQEFYQHIAVMKNESQGYPNLIHQKREKNTLMCFKSTRCTRIYFFISIFCLQFLMQT